MTTRAVSQTKEAKAALIADLRENRRGIQGERDYLARISNSRSERRRRVKATVKRIRAARKELATATRELTRYRSLSNEGGELYQELDRLDSRLREISAQITSVQKQLSIDAAVKRALQLRSQLEALGEILAPVGAAAEFAAHNADTFTQAVETIKARNDAAIADIEPDDSIDDELIV